MQERNKITQKDFIKLRQANNRGFYGKLDNKVPYCDESSDYFSEDFQQIINYWEQEAIKIKNLLENPDNEPIKILDYVQIENLQNIIYGHFLALKQNRIFEFKVKLGQPSIIAQINAVNMEQMFENIEQDCQ